MQPGVFRKLAAIMFTDIFGITSLMEKDEADAIQKKTGIKRYLINFTKNTTLRQSGGV